MVDVLLLVGLAVAVFVGFNIGGSSTGVAFGPAVGSRTVSKLGAATLMSTFFLLGGWTVGRNVIKTMGGDIVPGDQFTLVTSVGVLFFVGGALLISNLFGVPASTSMTAVGAIAGLGVATDTLNETVMFEIVSWWLLAPVMAFWICAVIGRYLYPYLDAWFKLKQSDEPILKFSRVGSLPYPTVSSNATRKQVFVNVLVVAIGCYMAFSAGASNVANAVAPLVGANAINEGQGVLIAAGALALGAFTIARRTLDTVGNDLTDLPLLAALIVEVVSASLITFLSQIGIPASLAVSATMCIVGLGWGRATRTVKISDAAASAVKGPEQREKGEGAEVTVNAITAEPDDEVAKIGEEDPDELSASDLFDPSTTARVVGLWILTPSISAVTSFLLFEYVPL
ncbi:inorganic phosphate transporter [Halomicrococcus gelatinilyticus]|uniref:inorganic phosphate transporter n=1 Tax=Halomicrococcus gelatinilyticus TaxID=1702103 RepID=UPI002E102B24